MEMRYVEVVLTRKLTVQVRSDSADRALAIAASYGAAEFSAEAPTASDVALRVLPSGPLDNPPPNLDASLIAKGSDDFEWDYAPDDPLERGRASLGGRTTEDIARAEAELQQLAERSQDPALVAEAALTPSERATFLRLFLHRNPNWNGARVADVLDTLDAGDSHLELVEPLMDVSQLPWGALVAALARVAWYVKGAMTVGVAQPWIAEIYRRPAVVAALVARGDVPPPSTEPA